MNNGYSICFNKWALDKNIKSEFRLLVIISSLTAETGYCFASNKYLANIFNETEISISNKIKKLEKNNYIEIEYEKRGCEITARRIRLKNILIDDYKFFKSTIKENFKDNNINIKNKNNNNKYIVEILDYLNSKTNSNYKTTTKSTIQKINARFKEGFTLEDFKKVIEKKTDEWMGTELEQYLRPDTLFGTKFESYLNQNIIKKQKQETRYEREQRIMKEWLEKNEED